MIKLSELKTELETLNYKVFVDGTNNLIIPVTKSIYIRVTLDDRKWTFIHANIYGYFDSFSISLYDDDNTIEEIIDNVNDLCKFIKKVIDVTIDENSLKPTYTGFVVIDGGEK